MLSVNELLAQNSPVLWLDACSSMIQFGWLERGTATRWAACDEEAGVGIFQCLKTLGVSPLSAEAFLFCDGPGSLLGIRSAATAVRTWCILNPKPVYSYHSLELVARFIGDNRVTVIADARRDAWHCSALSSPLRRVGTADLKGDLVMPDGFRNWTPLPTSLRRVSYSIADMLPAIIDLPLIRPCDEPDAFLHEEPSYVTWTPQIHRAPP